MRICLFFLITVFLMACSSTGNQRQEPENQTLETILNRKSVRKYKDRPVEKEKIDKLIRAGMAAPSSRDRRPWEFIIVTDRKALNTMAEGLPFARMLKETRQVIVVCGDTIKSSNAWFLDWFRRLAKPVTCRRIHGIGEPYGRLFTPIRTGSRSSGKSFCYRIISCR